MTAKQKCGCPTHVQNVQVATLCWNLDNFLCCFTKSKSVSLNCQEKDIIVLDNCPLLDPELGNCYIFGELGASNDWELKF